MFARHAECICLVCFIGAKHSHELLITSYFSTEFNDSLFFNPPITYMELQSEDETALKYARAVFIGRVVDHYF